jgi:hypothetical protein
MYKIEDDQKEKLLAGKYGKLVINKRLCACSQKELKTLYNCNIKGIIHEEAIQQESNETDEQSEN